MTSPGVDIPKKTRAFSRVVNRVARALALGPGAAVSDNNTRPKASVRAVRPNTPLVWPEQAGETPQPGPKPKST